MAFQSIRRVLPEAIRKAGIEEQVSSVHVVALAKETLERFWGPEKAQYIEWISYKDGALKIRAHAPAAKQELHVWQARLLNELNRSLGAKRVTKIIE